MRNITPFLFIVISISCFSQSNEREKRRIVAEGTKLYRSEMASWYGADIFMEKFKDKHSKARGYFSYVEKGKVTCVFFSEEPRKILASFTFDSTYNVNTAVIGSEERDMTALESDLLTIRTAALQEYTGDRNLFKSYEKMNPNFIPLVDELGKRVYILTGPEEGGTVVFGNDYLLTFNKSNKLTEKKELHANIIPIKHDTPGAEKVVTMHSHLNSTGDLITATDVCTLMLYCKFTNWKQHYVLSSNNVSMWQCDEGLVVVMTKEAWDKDQESKKPRTNATIHPF